ncbi:MAG: hypothetical protein RL303_1456, partial [Verrucomicrobiota bacterium]
MAVRKRMPLRPLLLAGLLALTAQARSPEPYRDADAGRKLGYLHCTVEAQKAVPTALRPALP